MAVSFEQMNPPLAILVMILEETIDGVRAKIREI